MIETSASPEVLTDLTLRKGAFKQASQEEYHMALEKVSIQFSKKRGDIPFSSLLFSSLLFDVKVDAIIAPIEKKPFSRDSNKISF